MTGIYITFAIIGLVLAMVASSTLTKTPDPARLAAGFAVKALCTLAAVGLAVYCATSGLWPDFGMTVLLLFAVTLDWDVTLSRFTGRPAWFTLWVAGVRWGSSTNRRQPPQ